MVFEVLDLDFVSRREHSGKAVAAWRDAGSFTVVDRFVAKELLSVPGVLVVSLRARSRLPNVHLVVLLKLLLQSRLLVGH